MLMEQLADYAIREQTSKLPPQVIHHAKRAVIDWYAALLPGSSCARDSAPTPRFTSPLPSGKIHP